MLFFLVHIDIVLSPSRISLRVFVSRDFIHIKTVTLSQGKHKIYIDKKGKLAHGTLALASSIQPVLHHLQYVFLKRTILITSITKKLWQWKKNKETIKTQRQNTQQAVYSFTGMLFFLYSSVLLLSVFFHWSAYYFWTYRLDVNSFKFILRSSSLPV